eukprot:TRINITY_DN8902_c0_g1_i1.p1 TRINITY_DN8902_c0_g1~~TRINITY_DN8902_c0_g1_i1.p1  ORF type:complete len:430 (+),score=98.44 TRINITY_DN8902_c0_g1_i1:38-1291(+)
MDVDSSTPLFQKGEFGKEVLQVYYDRLFPAKELYDWLSYGDPKYFANREISYAIRVEGADGKDDEAIIRFLSYDDFAAFKKDIKIRLPLKMDIGAVYNSRPINRASNGNFAPVEKELVFDIDANDYDDVRICGCKGKPSVCKVCWPLLTTAMHVIDTALKQDFGFEHIAWIFSGRRGVHCWVCDQRARSLSADARAHVAQYLAVISSKDFRFKRSLHPSLARAQTFLMKYMDQIAADHGLMDIEEHANKLLSYAPEAVRRLLSEKWSEAGDALSSAQKWAQFCDTIQDHLSNKGARENANYVADAVFFYAYPRLDIQVSKQWNHLLKSPFVVHPGTGNVCVPIDPTAFDEFDPEKVPTVQEVINELQVAGASTGDVPDWKKTKLAPYLELFKEFVRRSNSAALKDRRAERESSAMDF